MTGIDVLLSLFFGILAVGALRLAKIVYDDRFAPLGLYLGVTFSTLALWHLKLVSLIPISLLAYFIILLSVAGFIFGAFMATPMNRLWLSGSDNCPRAIVKGRGLKSFFYVIGLLSTIGWIILLIMFARDYSLATVWEEPSLLQSGFQSRRYIGYLNLLGILVLPTYVVLLRTSRGTDWLSVALVISALVGLLLAGIKSYLVFSFVTAFLVWGSYRRTGAPLRIMVIMAVCFIIFMILYNQIIDIYVQNQGAESFLTTMAPGLYRPYVYMVGSWSALTALADNPMLQPIWAYQSLLFLWKILGSWFGLVYLTPLSDGYLEIADQGTQSYNVYSMAGGLYWDFGLLGVLLGSAFWGWVSTRLYVKARMSHDWAWVLSSSIINYGLFLSFFTYYFTFNLLFLFTVVLVFIFFRAVVCAYLGLVPSTLSDRCCRSLVGWSVVKEKYVNVDSKGTDILHS